MGNSFRFDPDEYDEEQVSRKAQRVAAKQRREAARKRQVSDEDASLLPDSELQIR